KDGVIQQQRRVKRRQSQCCFHAPDTAGRVVAIVHFQHLWRQTDENDVVLAACAHTQPPECAIRPRRKVLAVPGIGGHLLEQVQRVVAALETVRRQSRRRCSRGCWRVRGRVGQGGGGCRFRCWR